MKVNFLPFFFMNGVGPPNEKKVSLETGLLARHERRGKEEVGALAKKEKRKCKL